MFRNEREALRFYASPGVVWFIPLIVALTAGAFVAFIIGLIGWRYFGDTRPLITFLITLAVVAFPIWARLTWVIFGKIDLGPRKQVETIRIEWSENGGRNLKRQYMKTATKKQFIEVCKMVVFGGTLSIGSLQPYFRNRESVQAFQRELIEQNLAGWNNPDEPKQGMSLTSKGQSIFRGVARSPMPGGE